MSIEKAYADKLEAQLKEWGAQLELLKAKAAKAGADAKVAYERQLSDWQYKHNAAADKLKELRSAGNERMQGLKIGVEKAWTDLKSAVDQYAPHG